jgi:hypothetical protein
MQPLDNTTGLVYCLQMFLVPEIVPVLNRLTGATERTIRQHVRDLMADPALMRKSKQGRASVPVTLPEVGNLLISLAAPAGASMRPVSTLETTRACRAAKRLRDRDLQHPAGTFDGLSFAGAETFGEAFDGLLDDMHAGAFQRWNGTDSVGLETSVRFYNGGGRIMLRLERESGVPGKPENLILMYRNDGYLLTDRGPCLTSVNELDLFIFGNLLAQSIDRAEAAVP